MRNVITSVGIDPETLEWAKAHAVETETSLSALVRNLLLMYRQHIEGEDPQESIDVGGDSPPEHLENNLRFLRRQIAYEHRMPGYWVFPNATLEELVQQRPKTPAQLRKVPGMGPKRVSRFGSYILEIINEYGDVDLERQLIPGPPASEPDSKKMPTGILHHSADALRVSGDR